MIHFLFAFELIQIHCVYGIKNGDFTTTEAYVFWSGKTAATLFDIEATYYYFLF
ncbi:hypothetical protein [Flectobacillus major]|jgi:hypothetical protein|uniref:hypothetical protein n=1 Tax=Flectobacillus major TaxID=103 RepID=UPI000426C93A|nr:hypothetical protein [Flectobacillus major]